MRFKKSSYVVRDGQTPSLWEVAEQHQNTVALHHRAKSHHQTLLNQTRHDSRNWVSSAKRFIEGNQPHQAMARLDVLNNWLDRPMHSSRLGLRRQMEGACQLACTAPLLSRSSRSCQPSDQGVKHSKRTDFERSGQFNSQCTSSNSSRRGTLHAMESGQDVVLRVSDTGGGLSDKTYGWGMGLSLIEQRIRTIGGSLELDNHSGVGVSVTARFNADRYSLSN